MKPTFANLVEAVARSNRQTKKATEHTLKRFFALLANGVWETGRVNVPGLGAFRVRSRKARRIADPQTGALITLPRRRVVACRVSSSWRRR